MSNQQLAEVHRNLFSIMESEQVQKDFEKILNNEAPAFLAGVIEYLRDDVNMQQCNPMDILAECKKAAILGLPVNKFLGQGYLVAYNSKDQNTGQYVKKPQFQIGYKGLIQLAMRTNKYKIINTGVVYEGELKEVNKLTGEFNFDGKRVSNNVIGYFAYFQLVGGYSKTLYMDRESMIRHAFTYSKSLSKANYMDVSKLPGTMPKAGVVGWLGNFDEMAEKTVLRLLLSKYGFLTLDMQSAMEEEKADEEGADVPADANMGEVVGFQEVQEEEPKQAPQPQVNVQPQSQMPPQQAQPQMQSMFDKPKVFNR